MARQVVILANSDTLDDHVTSDRTADDVYESIIELAICWPTAIQAFEVLAPSLPLAPDSDRSPRPVSSWPRTSLMLGLRRIVRPAASVGCYVRGRDFRA